MKNNIWIECERIGNVIANEFSNKFPEATILTDIQDFTKESGVKQFVVAVKIEGADLTLTVQDIEGSDKPFIYLDSIKVNEDAKYRGKGLSTALLDVLAGLVNRGIFIYLNLKNWGPPGYWDYMKTKYPFIRDKYENGFRYG